LSAIIPPSLITMNSNVYIVIPAKDEATRVGNVIKKTFLAGFENVIIVNDGSSDATEMVAKAHGATVLNHTINLGPGAATQTGLIYAVNKGADIIVTLDADEQHSPEDIEQLVTTMEKEKVDLVIGSRFLKKDNEIPPTRIFYNKIGNIITFILTGIMVTDSQSGMKAFSGSFAKKSNLYFNGFEFCVEIIRNLRLHNASFTEVPINVMYSEETMSKGQSLGMGIQMLGKLFKIF